ncbi:ABC transporter permease [Streptomyces sp. NPDC057694]|uniref:ABC transporter permease n=1 Tax=unclassified Streptomyces TaxID=2593676 RepID=UPI00367CFC20
MRHILRKLGFYAIAAWLAITLNFLLPRLIPGDPVQLMLARMQGVGGTVTDGQEESLRAMLGLGDGNLAQQYGEYLSSLAHLDFGLSITYFPTPVGDVVRQAVPWTLVLVGLATLLSVVIGLTLGMLAGWRRGGRLDALVPSATFLAAIPYFWVALLLLYLTTQVWNLLPQGGGYDETYDIGFSGAFLGSAVEHGILPAVTIVLSSVGGWMLGMRNMMVSTLAEDYVVAAEAKGLRPRTVMIGYAARNAVLPSVAGFAITLGFIVSGSLVMEIVFSYPGMGYTMLQAVTNNDYPLMQAVFLMITFAVLAANFLVDLVYAFIDPRTRQAGS